MASLVLSIAGGAIGGPVGSALGGLLGAYIDNTFILPELVDRPKIRPPQLGELNVQTVEEGAAANFVIGPETRVTGTVIWTSDFIVEEVEEEVGGKGGGNEVVTGHNVFAHIAIAICHNEIAALHKIFAEGNVVYDSNPDASASSALISIARESNLNMDINSPSGGPDLSVFRSGLDMVVAGFTNSANNGTFRVESSKRTSSGASRVRVRNALGMNASAGPLIVLTQTIPKFNQGKVQDVAIYLGTNTQNPDPLIESFEGPGEVPGYRGIAYVVLEKFYLGDYGNRIPQFSFLVEESASMTSGQAIQKVMTRAKGSGVTALTSEATRLLAGYPLRGLVPTAQALQPIQIALNVLDQETDAGAIRFFDREKATVIDIPAEDLGAVSFGEERSGDVEVLPEPKRSAPSEVHVAYLDRDADYQRGDQHQNRRLSHFLSEKLDFPLVLNGAGAEARQLARIILWLREMERRRFKLKLPPEYQFILENDVIRVPVHGQVLMLLVERIDIGENGMLDLECTLELRDVLIQLGIADPPSAGGTIVGTNPSVLLIPIDVPFGGTPAPGPGPIPGGGGIPPTTGGSPGRPGYGAAILLFDDEDEWPGAALYERTGASPSDPYIRLLTTTKEATAGRCRTTLGSATGGIWDLKNTLTVEMFHGTLENKTEAEVMAGWNRAIVGSEVIGFQTATLTGTNTYQLSGLLRGLRDTRDKIGSHAADEYFVLVNKGGISFIEIAPSRIGVPFNLKCPAIGAALDDVSDQAVTIEAKNLRPFSPANVSAVRSGNDIVVTWNRRTRENVPLFGPKPLAEAFERYEVDFAPDGGDPVRTVVVNDETSYTYTEAMQTTDGIDPEDIVDVAVYQISDMVGRSQAGSATAPGV